MIYYLFFRRSQKMSSKDQDLAMPDPEFRITDPRIRIRKIYWGGYGALIPSPYTFYAGDQIHIKFKILVPFSQFKGSPNNPQISSAWGQLYRW